MKKIALVTGASSGIGEDTALRLIDEGYTVYCGARRLERMKDLEKKGARLLYLDLTDDGSMVEGVRTIMKEQGGIDVLVNNAGYGSYGALEDVDLEEGKRQFDVCLFGLARLTQLVLPPMREKGSGKIINVSSIGGSFGEPHGAWYHAAKFAVEGMSDSLRMELKEFGIDVIIIKPGSIRTEWNRIAREKLVEVSGDTAYGRLARAHAQMLETYDDKGSDPGIIGRTIVKALRARRPKTRYTIGAGAGLMMGMRRLLTDRGFDAMMLRQMR